MGQRCVQCVVLRQRPGRPVGRVQPPRFSSRKSGRRPRDRPKRFECRVGICSSVDWDYWNDGGTAADGSLWALSFYPFGSFDSDIAARVTSGAWLKRLASGSPMPRRRTLTSAIVASVRSKPASLTAHGCARILRRLSEHGRPLAFSAERCASRRCCIAVSRAPDWPPGRRRFDERAEPAQAKTVRMPRVEPVALPTGRRDGGPHG